MSPLLWPGDVARHCNWWYVAHTAFQRLVARLGADSVIETAKIPAATTAKANSSKKVIKVGALPLGKLHSSFSTTGDLAFFSYLRGLDGLGVRCIYIESVENGGPGAAWHKRTGTGLSDFLRPA